MAVGYRYVAKATMRRKTCDVRSISLMLLFQLTVKHGDKTYQYPMFPIENHVGWMVHFNMLSVWLRGWRIRNNRWELVWNQQQRARILRSSDTEVVTKTDEAYSSNVEYSTSSTGGVYGAQVTTDQGRLIRIEKCHVYCMKCFKSDDQPFEIRNVNLDQV